MKKIIKKAKKYKDNVIVIDGNNLNKKLFRFVIFSLIIIAVSYALVIGSITFSVVQRQNLSASLKDLSNEVGELELKYLAKSNELDLKLSKELGFQEVKPHFATRKSISLLGVSSNEL